MGRNFFWQGGLYWQRVMTVIRSGETYGDVAFDSSAEVQRRRAVRRALTGRLQAWESENIPQVPFSRKR
ncbi:MAG TPA: hypothetical protein DCG00_04080 [Alistipes sp.]|nr:hypothetical protein [Alistipes sp.]